MAKYGYDFYGVGHYGVTPYVDYDASPFIGDSTDYGVLFLSWSTPTGSWDRLRLTRDPFGYSPRADLGTVLFEDLNDSTHTPRNTYTDTSTNIKQGSFYYYSLWVRQTSDFTWRRAGDVTVLATKNWGLSDRLFGLMPMVYRDKDVDSKNFSVYGKGQLERFCSIFGFQFDHIRTEFETLRYTANFDKVAGGVLPLLGAELGFGYEAELGMKLARGQIRNAIHLYKNKGNSLGIDGFATVMTGWATTVTMGVNLMLDQDGSAAVSSIGRWYNFSNAGTPVIKAVATSPVISAPVPPPSGASTGDVGSGLNVFQITAQGAGDMIVRSFDPGVGLPLALGIPVTQGYRVNVSIYGRANTTVRNAQVGVIFYNAAGTQVGSFTQSTSAAQSNSAWTRFNVTAIAPAGAVAAQIDYRVLSAASGEIFWYGAVQFEVVTNLLTNPGFETGVASPNTVIGTVTNNSANAHSGSWYLATVTTGAQQLCFGSPRLTAIPLYGYVFSFYGFGPSATGDYQKAWIEWYDSGGTFISRVISAQTNGSAAYNRIYIQGTAPSNAATFAVFVELNGPSNGNTFRTDDLMMEITSATTPSTWVNNDSPAAYQSARQVRITFLAERINYVLNPSFEVDATQWTTTGGSGWTDTGRIAATTSWGSNVYRVTENGATAGTQRGIRTGTTIPATPGTYWMLSSYVTPRDATGGFLLAYQWRDASGTAIGSRVDGTTQNITTGTETRLSLATVVAPASTAFLDVYVLAVATGTTARRYDFDGILVEKAQNLGEYFDGTSPSSEGEYVWEGTAMASRTHFYSRRLIKNYRMNQRLPDFLPAAATWTMLYAQGVS